MYGWRAVKEYLVLSRGPTLKFSFRLFLSLLYIVQTQPPRRPLRRRTLLLILFEYLITTEKRPPH